MTPVRAIFGAVPGEPAGRVLVYLDGGAPSLGEDVTARHRGLPGWCYVVDDVSPPNLGEPEGRVYLTPMDPEGETFSPLSFAPSVIGAAWVTPVLAPG